MSEKEALVPIKRISSCALATFQTIGKARKQGFAI